ncbi:hypothetical protein [Actinophytocola gossypii]|uniref:hypothetical protein n=1 Tax=Actinophytocola gossypii TaxID=2812003 RepID=UPI0028833A5A|nr:hypothetical protein [Actinophytocola gossypii]
MLVEPTDLRHTHTMHVNGSQWLGEPTNREPGKCTAVRWFPFEQLPARTIDYPAAGIHAFRAGVAFSTRGWSDLTPEA